MADLISDGLIKVSWVPTIGTVTAPTAVELNAGTKLEANMPPDGLHTDLSNATVPNSKLSSTYDTVQAGRRSVSTLGVDYIKQDVDSTDLPYSTLVFRAVGYLVVRRGKAVATNPTFTTGDKVEVYPAQCGQATPHQGPNTLQTYDVPMMSTGDPTLPAVAVV